MGVGVEQDMSWTERVCNPDDSPKVIGTTWESVTAVIDGPEEFPELSETGEVLGSDFAAAVEVEKRDGESFFMPVAKAEAMLASLERAESAGDHVDLRIPMLRDALGL